MKVCIIERTHFEAVFSDDETRIDGYNSKGSEIVAVHENDMGDFEESVATASDCDSHDSYNVIAEIEERDVDEIIKALQEYQKTPHYDGVPDDAPGEGDTPMLQEEPVQDELAYDQFLQNEQD
jgi:hypothetical protein